MRSGAFNRLLGRGPGRGLAAVVCLMACTACGKNDPSSSENAENAMPPAAATAGTENGRSHAAETEKMPPHDAETESIPGTPDANEKNVSDEIIKQAAVPEIPKNVLPDYGQADLEELDKRLLRLGMENIQSDDFKDYIEKITVTSPNPEIALRFLYAYESRFGKNPDIHALYMHMIEAHPVLNAKPRRLVYGQDVTGMKRLGGGSTLVYRFFRDGEVVAAYKPLQSRYQSNYRSEIAAYRICPLIKCGFDVPENVPVYFDFDEFSRMYARNSKNVKSEFREIIPTRLPDDKFRVDGTYKRWIPNFAEFPIEITSIWMPWLNPGTSRGDLAAPLADILPAIQRKHVRGAEVAGKLRPHMENTTKYDLARQISNMFVFDFLINNWDRFSGVPNLYGINCQFAHGRFMSIDNGASFSQTPGPKPLKHLKQISRFSRMTYDAIRALDKEKTGAFLFPDATAHELEKIDSFWAQRGRYLEYVQHCIEKNGEAETFFFE